MSTRARIAIPSTGGRFRSIYCHCDGDPGGVGKVLVQHYASNAKALALIEVGDVSKLRPKLAPNTAQTHTYEIDQPGATVAYGRDRGDKDCLALASNSFNALVAAAGQCNAEYLYVFVSGKWLYTAIPWIRGALPPTESQLREVAI
jgi:hypothetical protein